ncbi:NUDIX domain-containing protein [Candidatus Saccharibacteria bacterium]|nr:NUDIX domain-containing protein [Candidatus Saccharibacteria bacterium]
MTNKPYQHALLSAMVIFRDGNRILLLRRQNTGWCNNHYTFPTGHVDEGESIVAAATREAKEECNLEVMPKDLIFKHVIQRPREGHPKENLIYIDFIFEAKNWQGTAKIGELNKSDDLIWANPKELEKLKLTPTTEISLKQIAQGEILSMLPYRI